jgi:HSP20 family molecular chaperone IbpA
VPKLRKDAVVLARPTEVTLSQRLRSVAILMDQVDHLLRKAEDAQRVLEVAGRRGRERAQLRRMLAGLEAEEVDVVAQRRQLLLKSQKSPNNPAEQSRRERMNRQFKLKRTNFFFYENDFLWDR